MVDVSFLHYSESVLNKSRGDEKHEEGNDSFDGSFGSSS